MRQAVLEFPFLTADAKCHPRQHREAVHFNGLPASQTKPIATVINPFQSFRNLLNEKRRPIHPIRRQISAAIESQLDRRLADWRFGDSLDSVDATAFLVKMTGGETPQHHRQLEPAGVEEFLAQMWSHESHCIAGQRISPYGPDGNLAFFASDRYTRHKPRFICRTTPRIREKSPINSIGADLR